ncbi:MAG: helix-turn-helix domain-containing protein [Hydrogenovibrio sp.]|jgi:putative transcriptional regulator
MIRYKLKERIADKEFKDGARLMVKDIAEATGINRMTLSKILNQKGYNTTTDKLDKLAEYFDCEIGDLVERVREETTDE